MSRKRVCNWLLALCECRILDRWEIPSLFMKILHNWNKVKYLSCLKHAQLQQRATCIPIRDIRVLDEVWGLMRRHIMGDEADRCIETSFFKKLDSMKLLPFHFYLSFLFVFLFSFLMLRQLDTWVVILWPIGQISIL